MSVPVSDAVYQEVQQKVADHQASINLIQNQLDAASRSFQEWQDILSNLSAPVAPQAAPVVDGLG